MWGTESHSCFYHRTLQQQRTSLGIVNVFSANNLSFPVVIDIRSRQEIVVVNRICAGPSDSTVVIITIYFPVSTHQKQFRFTVIVHICNGHHLSGIPVLNRGNVIFQLTRLPIHDMEA